MFFNREEKAEKVFSKINKNYQEIAAKTKAIKKRPKVFTGFNFKGTWYVPGCKSYPAKYLADAGAELLCVGNSSGSIRNCSITADGDRLALIKKGQLLTIGETTEVITPENLTQVFGVEVAILDTPIGKQICPLASSFGS